jgi:hypothetical protein
MKLRPGQTILDLPAGSKLSVTTFRFIRPEGTAVTAPPAVQRFQPSDTRIRIK